MISAIVILSILLKLGGKIISAQLSRSPGSDRGFLIVRTASQTKEFKVGSRVANIDPTLTNYNWHGTIGAHGPIQGQQMFMGRSVSWDEPKGMKGGPILFHRLEELRLI